MGWFRTEQAHRAPLTLVLVLDKWGLGCRSTASPNCPRGGRRIRCWEGSRPRDPPFPEPRACSDQRRKYTVGFENGFAAREDARPPRAGAGQASSLR